jgi:hypothetical protein
MHKATAHPPISPEGFAGTLLFLTLTKAGQKPDPALLLYGLPQGGILHAELQHNPHDGSVAVAVTFRDQKDPTRQRSPRLMDPLGFLVLRLLMTPATLLRIDRTEKGPERKEGHRVTVHDDLILYRVIGDARPGQVIKQTNHYDLRRSSLFKTTETAERAAGRQMRSTHQGQQTAIERTLAAFDRYPPDHLPISREGLERLLKDALGLLNKLPLGASTA